MENVKIFESTEFGKVRTVEVNGDPYFVGKDVATHLHANVEGGIKHVQL